MVLETQVGRPEGRGRAYVILCINSTPATESDGGEKLVGHTYSYRTSLLCLVFFDVILRGLRDRVQHLEEQENLQRMLRRGSRIGLEPPPSDDNIDNLMRSMVTMSTTNTHQVSDGPWKGESGNVSNDSFNYEDTVIKGKQKM